MVVADLGPESRSATTHLSVCSRNHTFTGFLFLFSSWDYVQLKLCYGQVVSQVSQLIWEEQKEMTKAEPYRESLRQQPGLAQRRCNRARLFPGTIHSQLRDFEGNVMSREPVWAARSESSQWGSQSKKVCRDASADPWEEGHAFPRQGMEKLHFPQRN